MRSHDSSFLGYKMSLPPACLPLPAPTLNIVAEWHNIAGKTCQTCCDSPKYSFVYFIIMRGKNTQSARMYHLLCIRMIDWSVTLYYDFCLSFLNYLCCWWTSDPTSNIHVARPCLEVAALKCLLFLGLWLCCTPACHL